MSLSLKIFEFTGFSSGTIGIMRQPGETNRLKQDLQKISHWKPSILVSMTQGKEFPKNLPQLDQVFINKEYIWLHLPVCDFNIPEESDVDLFKTALNTLTESLKNNGRVLIHCRAGKGRSGMLAMRLLVEQGEDPSQALKRMRTICPGAIETKAQILWSSKRV